MKNKEKNKIKDYFLYGCFVFTIFLSLIMVLANNNICYLPLNTTGECVIARSIMSFEHYLLFLSIETIFSISVTVIYILDGFGHNLKKYKIIGLLNILLQPSVVFAVIWFLGERL